MGIPGGLGENAGLSGKKSGIGLDWGDLGSQEAFFL